MSGCCGKKRKGGARCTSARESTTSTRPSLVDTPLFRTSQWGWFWSCLLYSYGRSLSDPDRRTLLEARGFGETLTCGTCDRLRDALGEQGETLEKECRGCCKNGQVSYIQGRFEVCD